MDEQPNAQHYFGLIRRNIVVILGFAVLVGFVTAGVSLLQTTKYRGSAEILYDPAAVPATAAVDDPTRALDTLVKLASTDEVLNRALAATGYETTDDLRENLSVSADENADLMTVSVSTTSAQSAALATNAVAQAFLDWRTEQQQALLEARVQFLEQQLEELEGATGTGNTAAAADLRAQLAEAQAQLSIASSDLTLVQPSEPPRDPYTPHPIRNGIIGFCVGLLLGIVLVLVRDRLDRRLRTVEEIEGIYGVPTLGVVPYVEMAAKGDRQAGLADFSATSPLAAAFRTIRTNLSLFRIDEELPRVMVISSAIAEEGKSAATANLAAALAAGGSRVLAVSADVHSPALHQYFDGLSANGRRRTRTQGVIEVLSGESTLERAVRTVRLNGTSTAPNGTLALLANGRQFYDPAILFQSNAMERLLENARASYDVVVIDAPPLLAGAECLALANQADALLLVARVGRLTRDGARRAVRVMQAGRVSPLGVIVTGRRLERDELYGYGYGYGRRHAEAETIERP